MFRGTIQDGCEDAADTVDLMVELVQLLQQNQLYFRPKYSKKVSLKFHQTDINISWPNTPDGECAHYFTDEFMLIHEGKIYHNHWCKIETPTGFSHELVNMENISEYLPTTKFSDFLGRFSLSLNEMKKNLASKNESDSDEDFIVPRKSKNGSKLSKNTKPLIPKPRLKKRKNLITNNYYCTWRIELVCGSNIWYKLSFSNIASSSINKILQLNFVFDWKFPFLVSAITYGNCRWFVSKEENVCI